MVRLGTSDDFFLRFFSKPSKPTELENQELIESSQVFLTLGLEKTRREKVLQPTLPADGLTSSFESIFSPISFEPLSIPISIVSHTTTSRFCPHTSYNRLFDFGPLATNIAWFVVVASASSRLNRIRLHFIVSTVVRINFIGATEES